MKLLKKTILILLILLILGGIITWFYLNEILRSTVQSQATSALNLKTELGGANLSLFGGSVSLSDLRIASPDNFKADKMMTLEKASVSVNYSELAASPIRIAEVEIKGPVLAVEQSGGKFNFQAAMDQMPKSDKGADPNQKPTEPIKVVIGKMRITDAKVILYPGLPGLSSHLTIPLPPMELKDIGSGSNGKSDGANLKEVSLKIMSSMADAAAGSDKLTGDLRNSLGAGARQLQSQVENLTKDLGKNLDEAGKSLEKGIKGLFDKKKDEKK